MNFQKGHYESIEFPLSMTALGDGNTMLTNPRNGRSHGIPEPLEYDCPEYRDEMQAMLQGRIQVERGQWPSQYMEYCGLDDDIAEFLVMAGLSKDDPLEAAFFVQMDKPVELFNAITNWAAVEQIPLKNAVEVGNDFLGRYVHPFKYFCDIVSKRMEICFDAKYFYGMPRPEEYFGCPEFGAYGAPTHPEYPTGHGAFAGCAIDAFNNTYNASADERHSVEMGCRQLAHFRDAHAGVHIRSSSQMGVRVGLGEFD